MKLTQYHRDEIRRKLIGSRFNDRQKELDTREHVLATDIYSGRYSLSDRKLIDSLPEGWLPRVAKIQVTVDRENRTLRFVDRTVPVLARDWYYGDESKPLSVIDGTSTSGLQYYSIRNAGNGLIEEKKKLRQNIDAVLSSVTTTAKLIEAWPEIKCIVQEVYQVRAGDMLPTVQVTELNKVLGLPPTTK